jgi:hypothetical protein
VFINLKAMGANPLHKDLFVHADWMQPITSPTPAVVFKPSSQAIKMVIDAFARAPVENPDRKLGVSLHVDLGSNSLMTPRKTWGPLSKAGEVPFQAVVGSL